MIPRIYISNNYPLGENQALSQESQKTHLEYAFPYSGDIHVTCSDRDPSTDSNVLTLIHKLLFLDQFSVVVLAGITFFRISIREFK